MREFCRSTFRFLRGAKSSSATREMFIDDDVRANRPRAAWSSFESTNIHADRGLFTSKRKPHAKLKLSVIGRRRWLPKTRRRGCTSPERIIRKLQVRTVEKIKALADQLEPQPLRQLNLTTQP